MENQLEKVEQSPQVVELQKNSVALIESATNLIVSTKDEMDKASAVVVQLADIRRGGENLRKFFVQPFNDQVKNINAFFKNVANPVVTAETGLRNRITDYVAEQQRIADEKQKEADKEAAKAAKAAEKRGEKVEDFEAPAPQTPDIQTSSGRLSTKKVWTWKTKNEKLIPREYLMIDSVKIRDAIRSGERNIKGIEIYQEIQSAIR